MNEKVQKQSADDKKPAKSSKQEKLAQALRENLIRRKQINSSSKTIKNQ